MSHRGSILDLLLDDSWLLRDARLACSAHVHYQWPARRSEIHRQTVCEM